MGWSAFGWSCAAVVPSQAAYASVVAAIAVAAEPNHGPAVSSEVVAVYAEAAASSSSARPSQTAAAVSIHPGPGSAYMRA